jgi:hypothetical protein
VLITQIFSQTVEMNYFCFPKVKRMATIIINTKSKPARELVSFLKSLSFVKVLEDKEVEKEFTEETIEAIRELNQERVLFAKILMTT